jgi:hypothetical protein
MALGNLPFSRMMSLNTRYLPVSFSVLSSALNGFLSIIVSVFNDKYTTEDFEMDIVKLDVPLFIRLLELAREDVKQDADLHDVAEAVIRLSQEGVATMADYDQIVGFMQKQGDPAKEEIARIRQLGGMQ